MKERKNNFMTAKNKIASLKTSFVLSILGLVLTSNIAKGQNAYGKDNALANKVITKVIDDNSKHTKVLDSTIRIFPDDGFIKVVYMREFDFNNDAVSKLSGEPGKNVQLPVIDLYDDSINRLEVPGSLIYSKSIERVKEFPDILSEYLSKYLVLAITMDGEVSGHEDYVIYCAYDNSGKQIGYSKNSFVKLKDNIEQWNNPKPKKLSTKEKKLLEQELQKTR
jgi:hypothetical protein